MQSWASLNSDDFGMENKLFDGRAWLHRLRKKSANSDYFGSLLPPRRVPHISPRFCGEMWEISLLSLCNGRNPLQSPRDEPKKSVYFPHLPAKRAVRYPDFLYVAPSSDACAAFIRKAACSLPAPQTSQEIRGYGAPALVVEGNREKFQSPGFFRSLFSRAANASPAPRFQPLRYGCR
jgi:hypothetical protein